VDENVRLLLRYHWLERALMTTMLAHLPSTPTWEVKCALALHQWQSSLRIDALRRRIGEMRSPVPPLDVAPAGSLDAFVEELLRADDEIELVTGLYGLALPALARAYEGHLARANPLVDHPTRQMLRPALADASPRPMGRASVQASLAESPERWLERIAQLRTEGKHAEADKELAEFRRRHPDYHISDAVLQKVERK
jgi:hypothetical protein